MANAIRLRFEPLEDRRLLAATPSLLKDLNTLGDSSLPTNFLTVGAQTYFFAEDVAHGRELWVTDGSEQGTRIVADIKAGPRGSDVQSLQEFNGRALFFADDGVHGMEPWISDGTSAGTKILKDVRPGAQGSLIYGERNYYFVSSGLAYFTPNDGAHGNELWRTDGSANGTVLVADIRPGAAGATTLDANSFAAIGSGVFFPADDGVHGNELWRTDGTLAGTRLAADIRLGSGGSSPSLLTEFKGSVVFRASTEDGTALIALDEASGDWTPLGTFQGADNPHVFGDRLVFAATTEDQGYEWWSSDGTPGGTSILADFNPAGNGAVVRANTVAMGGRLYLVGQDSQGLRGIWSTDGTSNDLTRLPLTDFAPNASLEIVAANENSVFFVGTDAGSRRELWKTDAQGNASKLALLRSQIRNAEPEYFVVWQNALYFPAEDAAHGRELWRSDGTIAGTAMLADVNAGEKGSSLRALMLAKDRLLFSANDTIHGGELWTSDGSAEGTRLLADLSVTTAQHSSGAAEFTEYNGWVYFRAGDTDSTSMLWRTRGSAGTVEKVLDSNGQSVNAPSLFTQVGGVLYFRAVQPGLGVELWRTDGTAEGTHPVVDLAPGGASSSPDEMVGVGNLLFFNTSEYIERPEGLITPGQLWRSDGTPGGTFLVTGGGSLPMIDRADRLVSDGKLLYFTAASVVSPTSGDPKLWRSDGTRLGTFQLIDTTPSNNNPSITMAPVAFQGFMWFTAFDDARQNGLYRTDGTVGGTVLVHQLPWGEKLWILAALGDRLMLAVDDGQSGQSSRELWATDGTSAGTQPVFAINGAQAVEPENPTVLGNLLFFLRKAANDHWTLWRTDGTNGGTLQLTTVAGSVSQGPLVGMDGRLYFGYDDGVHGYELWSSDGTKANTSRVASSGTAASLPWPALGWDGVLFFNAQDPQHGSEPWILDTVLPGDINRDGKVDLTDFGVQKANFGSGSARGQGDANRDGKVDLTDFGILKSRFGAVSSVPAEPAAFASSGGDASNVDHFFAALALAMGSEQDAERRSGS
jgi:ELWxxDGT repeat protein